MYSGHCENSEFSTCPEAGYSKSVYFSKQIIGKGGSCSPSDG